MPAKTTKTATKKAPAKKAEPEVSDRPVVAPDGLVEPDDDETGDLVYFVRNGWVRCVIAGQLYKLRRPFLGEMEDLEKATEADAERLREIDLEREERQNELLDAAKRIEEEAADLDPSSSDKARLDRDASRLMMDTIKEMQRFAREADKLRAAWWKQVFETLTPPGQTPPEDVPSWVVDPAIQQRIAQHWRAAPLVYGN